MTSGTLRTYFSMLILLSLAAAGGSASGQDRKASPSSTEAEIRKLDLAAAKAVQQKDERAIARFFAENSVTNDPRNGLTRGSSGVIQAARMNLIDYATFDRVIESIQVLGKTVVVMGNETVVFKSQSGEPATPIHRRYTNVWMKAGKGWQIVARHANVICNR